jgi:hypothetical protein
MSSTDRAPILYAAQFERNSPTLTAMAAALKLTDEQVDALFIAAREIQA